MKNAILNWSGGKDCAYALYLLQAQHPDAEIRLLTTIAGATSRVSMHGIRSRLIEKQAEASQLRNELVLLPDMPDNQTWENRMAEKLFELKKQGFETSVFGDIFLEDLRQYRETQLARTGMKAVFPLWKMDTRSLALDFAAKGFKAVVVAANDKYFGKAIMGAEFNRSFIDSLPSGVDPCGENGEFHTFVYDGPVFRNAVGFKWGEIVHRRYPDPSGGNKETGFWFVDLLAD